MIIKTYPIIEEAEDAFEKLKSIEFKYVLVPENKLVPLGVGNMVNCQELNELRTAIVDYAREYGFPAHKPASTEVSQLDKKIGKILFEKMDITPSIAATIPMWHFINLCLLPDYIYWRFGASKDHYLSDRRNYFGTQWWRYYLFCILYPDEDVYMTMSDRNVADLYERTNSCGYSKHIVEQYAWFSRLYEKNPIEVNEIRNRDNLFRACLKLYGARLSYRLYFSLTDDVKEKIFKECFYDAIPIVLKEQIEPMKIKIKMKAKVK